MRNKALLASLITQSRLGDRMNPEARGHNQQDLMGSRANVTIRDTMVSQISYIKGLSGKISRNVS